MIEYSSETGAVLPDIVPASYAPDSISITVSLADEFANLPLTSIAISLTNPRTIFNPQKLAELASSIKASGVHQPVLVRPLPASRLDDTFRYRGDGNPLPTHELVCGERRLRACKLAGVLRIPALIRNLTDGQVLEIQIIENLQRDDLSPLEEAVGYQQLMSLSNITADEVGLKIDKSRSYVYGRLKLLDLTTEARISLRDGVIDASRAQLLARIPDIKLQIKALKEIVAGEGYYGGSGREPMSYRQAATHIQKNYMLRLDDAKFDIVNADLVSTAGSCKKCTKRTGHDPDLFNDVKSADVCTDPTCFHKKEEAHAAILVLEAKDKGQTVISGKEAQELMSAGYTDKFVGYRRLDAAEDSPTDQPLRKIIGKQMEADGIKPVMIEHPKKKGELVATLPNEVVLRLLKIVEGQAQSTKVVAKEVRKFADEKKAKAEAKAKDRYEQDWRDQLLKRTWEVMQRAVDYGDYFNANVHRYVALRAASSLSTEQSIKVAELLGLGKVGAHSAVLDHIKTRMFPDEVHMLMIMVKDSSSDDFSYRDHLANEGLHLVAGIVFGNELKSIQKEIQTQSLAKVFPKIKEEKAVTPNAPAAQAIDSAGGGGTQGGKVPKTNGPAAPASVVAPLRKRKLSAAEAQAEIAVAMQSQETDSGAAIASQGIEAASGCALSEATATAAGLTGEAVLPVGAKVQIVAEYAVLQMTLRKWAEKKGVITAYEPASEGSTILRYSVTFRGRNGGVASFLYHQLKVLSS